MEKNRPVKTVRLGRIQVAIWLNVTDDGRKSYRTSITRRFQNGNGEAETTSYTAADLPVVGQAAAMAYAWIWEQECQDSRRGRATAG